MPVFDAVQLMELSLSRLSDPSSLPTASFALIESATDATHGKCSRVGQVLMSDESKLLLEKFVDSLENDMVHQLFPDTEDNDKEKEEDGDADDAEPRGLAGSAEDPPQL